MKPRLRPCPWCGNKPEILMDGVMAVVKCSRSSADECPMMPSTWRWGSKKKAVEAWNWRPKSWKRTWNLRPKSWKRKRKTNHRQTHGRKSCRPGRKADTPTR